MTSTYKTTAFSYIANNKEEIARIANQLNVSKEAIAGAIVEEYDSYLNSKFLNERLDKEISEVSHQTISNDYLKMHLPKNRDKLLNADEIDKATHVTLNDVGFCRHSSDFLLLKTVQKKVAISIDPINQIIGTKFSDHIHTNHLSNPENTANKILGFEGDDIIQSYGGNDYIDGGADNDFIAVESGTNILIGGEGSDIFSIQNNSYTNTNDNTNNKIKDFEVNNTAEKIDLRSFVNIKQFSDLNISQNGNDAIINLSEANKIVLSNINISDLSADNFVFYNNHYVGSELNDELTYQLYKDGDETITIEGKGGDDKLYASYSYGGNDEYVLDGGDGNDELKSSNVNSQLIGGNGNDKFIIDDFNNPYSLQAINTTTIADFKLGNSNEKIIINSNNVGEFSDLLITQQGSDVQITIGENGNKIFLKNILVSQISEDSFEINFFNHNPNMGSSNQFPVVNGIVQGTETGEVIFSSYPNIGNYVSDIYGLGGDDNISSQGYEKNIYGGEGDDIVYLFNGDSNSFSTSEHQVGAVNIYGEAGNDRITQVGYSEFVNVLDGGEGDDQLLVYYGNATLIGGSGNDSFEIDRDSNSTVTIEDFEIGNSQERIDLSYDFKEINNLDDLNLEQVGSDTIINLPENQKIILKNINKNDLTIDNFKLVLSNKDQSGNIVGSNNSDEINGYEGDDIIDAKNGSDSIRGGSGNDKFIITQDANAVDSIEDFNISNEQIMLRDFDDVRSFSDLQISYHSNQYNFIPEYFALVNLGNGQFLKIKNATPQNPVSESNFIFELSNTAPTASLVSSSTLEDVIKIIDVLAEASDVDGDTLTISSVTSPAHGTATIITNAQTGYQTISYIPNVNYNGVDSFDYTIFDGNGGTITKTLNLQVNSVNDAPTATFIDTQILNEDASIDINLLSGTADVDGDILNISLINNPSHGVVSANQDGTFKYTPNANYNGSDVFTYTISDGNGAAITKTINLQINSVNDAPVITQSIIDRSAVAGNNFSFTIPSNSFADIEGSNLTYSAKLVDALGNQTNLPSWISFNPTTRTFTGTPPSGSANNIIIAVIAGDGVASTSQTFHLDIASNAINGTSGVDQIDGTNANDFINGGAGNDALNGGAGDDILNGGEGADNINGGSGNNTISYINASSAISVDLNLHKGLAGEAAGDVIAYIHNIIGSNYNDTLVGSSGVNKIDGGLGNDTISGGRGADNLNGGAGIDTITYLSSASAVNINLTTGTGSGGDAQGDIISNVENIIGSNHNDTLIGDAGNNIIIGGNGADTINGNGGIDTVSYVTSDSAVNVNLTTGTGNGGDAQGDIISNVENITGSNFTDILTGDAGNNTISGGQGNDTINGGAGADIINGNSGNDTVSYATSNAGVNVNLATKIVSGGDAGGDLISEIENITGSNHNDILTGGIDANIIDGGTGNDIIKAGAGNDIIIGGTGQDTLSGGGGQDQFVFKFFSDSSPTINTADIITDFKQGQDKINLHNLNLLDHFITFDSNPNDDNTPQGLSYHFDNENNTIIEHHDGNQNHDFAIKLIGHINLGGGDFEF